ncbi:hypothetical protein OnM2_068060 [Erysiphe neolycopersici]|uniref:Uncharacterized protein n=1 Tax=Erysiphe neolycopersici TaxID=212602 RepID=A0A420HLK0_9PEZI|nr:hypothetical protein OnM2_068060 [Erysiphe neolycopersici]
MKVGPTCQLVDIEEDSMSQINDSKPLIFEKGDEVNNGLLDENAIYATKKSATKAFLTDDRHVGIQFAKHEDKRGNSEHMKFTCKSKTCPARLRFQKCTFGWKVTVANHHHNHETSYRTIRHSIVIEDFLRKLLHHDPTFKPKGLKQEVENYFKASVEQSLVTRARNKILEKEKLHEHVEKSAIAEITVNVGITQKL